jgi:hypothetical protein
MKESRVMHLSGLVNGLITATEKFFDGNPIMLDAPREVPPEFPRIILKTPNQVYELHIGLNRFDFYYHDKTMVGGIPEKEIDELKDEFIGKLGLITSAIKKVTGVKITRLGIVPTLVSKVDDEASEYVRKTYLNTSIFSNKLSEANLTTNRKIELGEILINLGFRISAFKNLNHPLDNKLVMFNYDINTRLEEPLDLLEKDIKNFCQNAFEFIGKNLQIYSKTVK